MAIGALVAAASVGCQGMDRLEPDEVVEVGVAADERGSMLDGSSASSLRAGGPLTEETAGRWLRQIQAATGEERLGLAEQFWREYPEGDAIYQVHELVGDTHSELGNHEQAADAWERAIEMSWPAPDLLELPLTNVQLPYEVGWARYRAGEVAVGADWLVKATFISDRPQLDQGLRFLYGEFGDPDPGYDRWLEARRDALAASAPDFELPGYQSESLRLSEVATRLTLINFWTPT
jgi:tetratricopeptide (TPR) repeat protein